MSVCVCVCLSHFCHKRDTPQYLSQMKSELHETFRITYWGSPKMIQHFKDDPIFQGSSQEPSTYSKYGLRGRGVLDTLLSMVESWNSRDAYHDDPRMSRMTPSSKTPVRNHQRPPSMTSRTGGSWHTSNHTGELKFGTQVKNHISWQSMMTRNFPILHVSCQKP